MDDQISEIVSVAEMEGALHLLFVDYQEGDAGNAVGAIYRTDGSRDPVLDCLLTTNDTLCWIWAAPDASLWAASANGNVWTNAKVKWPAPRQSDLDFQSLEQARSWSVTTLPDSRDEGHAPTLGVIWGTSDTDVFVAAGGGHIYQWNGKDWRQSHLAGGDIRAFAGTGPADVYAVGEGGTLRHYDGQVWTALQPPGDAVDDETFTGCCIDSDGALLVCSQAGRLLRGTSAGLTVLATSDDLQFKGISLLDNRIMLAAGSAGVAEFNKKGFVIARDTFHAVSVFPAGGRLVFLDDSSELTYVEFKPSDKKMPWARIDF